MLPLKLLLVALVLCFFEGETKFGETAAKRRRCLNGSPPRRLKKRDRRLMLLEPPNRGELLCQGFYPRLSCCSRAERQGLLQIESNKVGSSWVGYGWVRDRRGMLRNQSLDLGF